jgi:hypothetical protein
VAKFKGVLNNFAKEGPHAQIAKRFLAEMRYHEKMEDVNPAWLYLLHFRFAAAVSPITADQKTLFSHVPFPSLFFGMTEKDAWKNEASAFANVKYYDNKGFELPDYHIARNLSPKFIDRIYDYINRALPAKVRYPVANKGKLGVSTIVRSNINDIYPIAFPFNETNPEAEAIGAHGIKLSTFPFATHDALHERADLRRYNFIQHVVNRVDQHVSEGGDAREFARVYTPIALQRYHMVMGLLNHIYNNMVGTLLPNRGLAEYRKAMTGFFWIDHENPNFSPSIYNMNDVDKILETITSQEGMDAGAFSIKDIDSWTSPYDPLETSPIDGSSRLSDDAIYKFVEDNLTTADSNNYKYSPLSYDETLNSSERRKIVRGKRFIDVFYRANNGDEYKFTFPTMYHKWLNTDDNLGLLKYGGTVITKPDLQKGDRDPRDVAQETLIQIEQGIKAHVDHFRSVASYFVNRGGEDSLAKRYFKQHFNQEQQLDQAELKTFKSKQKELKELETLLALQAQDMQKMQEQLASLREQRQKELEAFSAQMNRAFALQTELKEE